MSSLLEANDLLVICLCRATPRDEAGESRQPWPLQRPLIGGDVILGSGPT